MSDQNQTEYIYWTFECKTPECKNVVAFSCGGVYNPKRTPFYVLDGSVKSFTLFCPACEQRHEYSESEVKPEISSAEPSPDFPRTDSK